MHVMRYLLIQLLLQVLLHPDEYWEAAVDVTICCKKSFPAIAQGENSQQESDEDGSKGSDDDEDSNEEVSLEFMDVLVQTFLSILPHASGPVCFTIEQASILCCSYTKVRIFEESMLTILGINDGHAMHLLLFHLIPHVFSNPLPLINGRFDILWKILKTLVY